MRHLLIAICFVLAANVAAAEVRYTIVDLSTLGPTTQFPDSLSMNNAGQVAGNGGVWNPDGTLTPMPFVPSGINDLGQVIGTDGTNAFLWTPPTNPNDPGTIQDLGVGYPTGIKNNGTVVGDYYFPPDGYQPWLWTLPGGRQALSLDNEFVRGTTIDINDAGTIVGLNPAGASIYIWEPGSTVGHPFYHPDGQAYGWDINHAGQIAGQGPDYTGMLYTPGVGFQSLGYLNETQGWAIGLNEVGQVVGITTRDLDDDLGTAWIWSAAEDIVDLNTLIPSQGPDGWFLRRGWSINNSGQIVGIGRRGDDENVVFLLNPIPEPLALELVIVASAIIGVVLLLYRTAVFSRCFDRTAV